MTPDHICKGKLDLAWTGGQKGLSLDKRMVAPTFKSISFCLLNPCFFCYTGVVIKSALVASLKS